MKVGVLLAAACLTLLGFVPAGHAGVIRTKVERLSGLDDEHPCARHPVSETVIGVGALDPTNRLDDALGQLAAAYGGRYTRTDIADGPRGPRIRVRWAAAAVTALMTRNPYYEDEERWVLDQLLTDTGWSTARRLRVGDTSERIRALYPGAVRSGARWTLAYSCGGMFGRQQSLVGIVRSGRLAQFSMTFPWD